MAEKKPVQAQPSTKQKVSNLFRSPLFKVLLLLFLIFFIGTSAFFVHYDNFYSKIIDRRLGGEVFKNTAQIYATPFRIYPGQKLSSDNVIARLQRAGFDRKKDGATGDLYDVKGTKITIQPLVGDPMQLEFGSSTLAKIVKPGGGGDTEESWLPAELVTNLYDESREKRRLVEYKDLPQVFVDALLASEDQHFFKSSWD